MTEIEVILKEIAKTRAEQAAQMKTNVPAGVRLGSLTCCTQLFEWLRRRGPSARSLAAQIHGNYIALCVSRVYFPEGLLLDVAPRARPVSSHS
jgi:hypothetical protein